MAFSFKIIYDLKIQFKVFIFSNSIFLAVQMNLDGEMIKGKVADLVEVYNFVVGNLSFEIINYLKILYFEIQIFELFKQTPMEK